MICLLHNSFNTFTPRRVLKSPFHLTDSSTLSCRMTHERSPSTLKIRDAKSWSWHIMPYMHAWKFKHLACLFQVCFPSCLKKLPSLVGCDPVQLIHHTSKTNVQDRGKRDGFYPFEAFILKVAKKQLTILYHSSFRWNPLISAGQCGYCMHVEHRPPGSKTPTHIKKYFRMWGDIEHTP